MPPDLEIVASEEDPQSVACDAVVVGAFAGDDGAVLAPSAAALDETLEGRLSEALRASGYKGKKGEVHTLSTLGHMRAQAIVVTGLGSQDSVTDSDVRRAAGAAARRLSERTIVASAVARDVDGASKAEAEGFLLGAYTFPGYRAEPPASKLNRILLLGADPTALEHGAITAGATLLARDLVNEPPDRLTPTALAARAREAAEVAGLECKVYEKQELEERGFGGLLTVARGSAEPPCLVEIRYRPENPTAKVALVGKGVTFDSGGLSIKPAAGMEQMKTDMAGAAAVLGAMTGLARIKPSVEVLALLPTTENMPGPTAVRIGDVITHYGGRTTEVVNSDAEGRLILGDAIALASEDEPDAIVDVATLTGSVVVALGKKVTGLFASDDGLRAEIRSAASRAGERVWDMPLFDDYATDLESEVADNKNAGTRYGGSIQAAVFLKAFVGKGIPWAHLDIAGPARADGDTDEGPRGGTGVATRTLIAWVEDRGRAG